MNDHQRISRKVVEALKKMGIDASTSWSGNNLIIYRSNRLDPDKMALFCSFSSALNAVGFSHSVMASE